MSKIFKITLIMITILIMIGCGKNYEKLTYTDYQEYFNNKTGYVIQDNSSLYEINIRRYLEAGNGNVQVYYIEYAEEEDAIKHIEDSYLDKDGYKVKLKDNYSYVKSTRDKYQKIYRVDNIIINALTLDKKYKKEVNSILKDLGF